MTNAKESYEAKILETLIHNNRELGEIKKELEKIDDRFNQIDDRFSQIDDRFDKMDSKLNWLFAAVFSVAASILAALYSEPLLSALRR